MTLNIALTGYNGRMGQLIAAEITANPACKLIGGVVRTPLTAQMPIGLTVTQNAAKIIPYADVVIDFTAPDAAADYAEVAATFGKPYMTGTTGLSAEQMARLIVATKVIPVLQAPNTSLSLAIAAQLAKTAAGLLRGQNFDAVITDIHHRHKKDAPSGTARRLALAVTQGSDEAQQAEIASIRAGSFVGEHEVIFAGDGESLTIRHSVTDRRIFARGAVQAALWLHGKQPGYYTMDDVLGIEG